MSTAPRPPLKALSQGMRNELIQAGIEFVRRPFGIKVYDGNSDDLKTLLRILSKHKLGESGVHVFFRYQSWNEIPYWKVGAMKNPFRELTAAVLDGLEFWRDNREPCHSFMLTQHLLLPAKVAIPKVLKTLQHPPSDECPIAHALPPKTYLTHACFAFKKWSFAVRICRE